MSLKLCEVCSSGDSGAGRTGVADSRSMDNGSSGRRAQSAERRAQSGGRRRGIEAPGQSTLTSVPGFGSMKHVKTGGLIAKRWPVVCGVLLVAAVVGLLWWSPWEPPDPVYKGRRLSIWLKHNRGSLEDATEAVRQAGTNAIPTLLRMLRARDSAIKVKLMDWVERRGIIKGGFRRASQFNSVAFHGFVDLGTNAQSAVPALMEIANRNISSDSKDYALNAVFEVCHAGPPAKETVRSLLRWATNADAQIRWKTISALTLYHHEEADGNANLVIRTAASEALFRFQANPALVVPALTNALHDAVLEIQAVAFDALVAFGPDAKIAVPALVEYLNASQGHSNSYDSLWHGREAYPDMIANGLRYQATNALWHIDPEAATNRGVSIADIILSLSPDRKPPIERRDAAYALSLVGKGDSGVVAALTKALTDNSRDVRWQATNSLLKLDPEAAAMTAGEFAAGVVNEKMPHGLGGGSEEMGAILKSRVFAADQAQPDLMHQCGGLQRVARSALRHFISRQLAQLRIDQRQQFIGGLGIALLHGFEDARHLTHGVNHIQSQRQGEDPKPRLPRLKRPAVSTNPPIVAPRDKPRREVEAGHAPVASVG